MTRARWTFWWYRFATQVALFLTVMLVISCPGKAQERSLDPVRIGLTAEFGLKNSTSAQAVEMGIRVALDEINARGGVLGGRPLVLEVRDDRSVPARAVENVKELAAMKDVVAIFGARFSPVLIELVPLIQEIGMILLDPWSSADEITRHGYRPNFVFRLSLTDNLAMSFMLSYAKKRGLERLGLLLPNTAWGRSGLKAVETQLASMPPVKIMSTQWFNWGDASLSRPYEDLIGAGAEVIISVANDREGAILLNEMLKLPREKRVPILSHWGVTGGTLFEHSETALLEIDFSVIQTFSFFTANPRIRERFMSVATRLYPLKSFEEIKAPVGVGQAYDLTHLLALAIDKAGSADRAAIRNALENLGPYEGLVATLKCPFSPQNHDALGMEQVFMAKYRQDGVLVPISVE